MQTWQWVLQGLYEELQLDSEQPHLNPEPKGAPSLSLLF